jgi:ribonucleotide reductase beta subunit family protein with ferritin-like domain
MIPLRSVKISGRYHVQISLIMSQQTQSDIFHTKMLQNALWCQITWSKCMLCNILPFEDHIFSEAYMIPLRSVKISGHV